MADTTVQSSLSNADIDAIIAGIDKVLTGRAPDKHRIKDTFYAAFTSSMFGSIHEGFLEKFYSVPIGPKFPNFMEELCIFD